MTTQSSDARAVLDSAITEKAFQTQVIQLAELNGWLVYHEYDSRRSAPGFPDLVLAHPAGRLIFAELKTERGRLRASQKMWLRALDLVLAILCVYNVPERYFGVYIWRPRDWDNIEAMLCEPQRTGVAWCDLRSQDDVRSNTK